MSIEDFKVTLWFLVVGIWFAILTTSGIPVLVALVIGIFIANVKKRGAKLDKEAKALFDVFNEDLPGYPPCMITFYDQDGNVLLKEPSLVAQRADYLLVAIGNEVHNVIAESEASGEKGLMIGSPFKGAVVAHYDKARIVVRYLWHRTGKRSRFFKHRVLAYVPEVELTQVEARALDNLLMAVGASQVHIVSKKTAGVQSLADVINYAKEFRIKLIVEFKVEDDSNA